MQTAVKDFPTIRPDSPVSRLRGLTRPGDGFAVFRNPGVPAKGSDGADSLPPHKHMPVSWQNKIIAEIVGPNELGDIVTKQRVEYDPCNVMNTYGLFRLASLLGAGATFAATTWLAAVQLGTGTAVPATNDAGLQASTGTQIIAGENDATGTWNLTYLTTASGSRTIQVAATFPSNNPAGSATIGEVALYCYSSTTSNIAAHGTLNPAISKGASDVIQLSYQLVATSA